MLQDLNDYDSWKANIKSNMDEWLDQCSDIEQFEQDDYSDLDDLNSPDLYSFYSELSTLNLEHKKVSKRNHEFSIQINDFLKETENSLDTIVKQLNNNTDVDEYKTRLFKPLIDVFIRFERIGEKIQNSPKITWFLPQKKLKNEMEVLKQAFSLVKSHLDELLISEKVLRIKTLNTIFDPFTMIAVAVEERDEIPTNTVIEEIKPGFLLKDKIFVLAEVKVSKNKGSK